MLRGACATSRKNSVEGAARSEERMEAEEYAHAYNFPARLYRRTRKNEGDESVRRSIWTLRHSRWHGAMTSVPEFTEKLPTELTELYVAVRRDNNSLVSLSLFLSLTSRGPWR